MRTRTRVRKQCENISDQMNVLLLSNQLLFNKSIVLWIPQTLTTRIKHIRIVILCVIINFMTFGVCV